ncbi:hypothetical protein QKW52_16945 [Bacillus sonorensis]|nr:hypothetical protein [Bacillus sonorensis]
MLLRLAPIHFDAVSYAAGVSKVRPLSFLAATACGIIPGTVILNALGSSLLSGDLLAIVIVSMIYLLFITVPLLFRKKCRSCLIKGLSIFLSLFYLSRPYTCIRCC